MLDYRACDDQCDYRFRRAPLVYKHDYGFRWAPPDYVLNYGSFGRASLDYNSIRRAPYMDRCDLQDVLMCGGTSGLKREMLWI